MINVKYRTEYFPRYDYRGVEEHLSAMAAKGWQIEDMERIFWKYRRIEPKKMTYAVTYLLEASEFNPYPTKGQETLEEYCEQAGWKKVADWQEMQVFCTERENPIPIETDETVRLELIRRLMKKYFFTMGLFNLFLVFSNMSNTLRMLNRDPVQYLAEPNGMLLIIINLIILITVGVNWGSYYFWFWRSKYRVERGKECARTYFYRIFNKVLEVAAIIFFIIWSLSMWKDGNSTMLIYTGILLGGISITLILTRKFSRKMKENGFSKGENITWTAIAEAILVFLFFGIYIVLVFELDLPENNGIKEYTVLNMEQDRQKEEVPVIIQDLMEVDFWKYSYFRVSRESFVLKQTIVNQDIKLSDYEVPTLWYQVIEIKIPNIYNWILSRCLNIKEEQSGYVEENDRFWNADVVYRYFNTEDENYQWILCKERYIIRIRTSWELTKEQKEIIIQNIYQWNGIDDSIHS